MPAEVAPPVPVSPALPPRPAARPAWWVRALSRVPLAALYGVTGFAGWLAWRVFPYRARMIDESLARAFPELSEQGVRSVRRSYCLGFAQMLAELVKGAALTPAEIRHRVRIVNLEEPRSWLAQGQSVLLVAAHQ